MVMGLIQSHGHVVAAGTWIFTFGFSWNFIEQQWWVADLVRELAGTIILLRIICGGEDTGTRFPVILGKENK